MKTTATRVTKTAAFLVVLGLTACGGGSDTSTCVSGISTVCDRLSPIGITSPADAAADAAAAAARATPVFTTAPSAITMVAGSSASYAVGGGTGFYTATSGNTGVVTVSLSGKTLTVTSIAAGTAPIAIVDSAGKSVTVVVTILGIGQTGIPLSISPSEITVSDCTTNIPFVFSGGTAPFTILTSDNIGVPVSAALPVGPNSYFMTSLGALATISSSSAIAHPYPGKATVTVLDSQSRTASAVIKIDVVHDSCPKNPLLQIVSASQNAHVTETLAFQIIGGRGPFTVISRDKKIGIVSDAVKNSDGTSYFNATAVSTGLSPEGIPPPIGSSLLTVISADSQQANIVFTVYSTPVYLPPTTPQ